MSCTICINDGNIKTMYNDCIIESLEKIKFHYMSLKSKLCENEQLTKSLKEENDKLKKTVSDFEEIEKNKAKKRRTAVSEDDNDSEISFSQNVAKSIAQKSAEDLNMALNFDDEFELSFIPSTQVENEKKHKTPTVREPLKTLPVKPTLDNNNKQLNIKQEAKSNEEQENNNCNKKSATLKKSSSWISKENELKKSVIGSLQKQRPNNRILRHIKNELKSTSLSLKPGKLRQTRLQLDMSKNMSSNFSDTTFCDEAIEASPNADFSVKRINTSKQWQLRNISSKIIKSNDDSILEFENSCPKRTKSQSPPQNKSLEASSVVMYTPASQDIIFLDDSCESFNIESMDLLKDLMNPTENLSNLKRLESDRIKMLQKTNGGHAAKISSKCLDFDEKQNPKASLKTEHEFTKPKTVNKNESKKVPIDEKALSKEHSGSGGNNNVYESPVKMEKVENGKRTRIFNIDCNECQTYIKYLGARLTDEEIEQHIRNCTNHKKRIDDNLTPDGFWDPLIKPFDSDDPRNFTIIDDPFVEKKC